MVGIYLAAVIVIQFPLCNFMSELLVQRNLSKFNDYCQGIKQGRYHAGFDLPPGKGKEHDFIRAKRNLYWMGHALASREKKLIAAMDNLKTAQMKIMESIEYASSIQHALLPPAAAMEAAFPEHFIWWAPRDVVGGDTYWACEKEGCHLIALIDCTGHGVPGAFMTLIVYALLDQCLRDNGHNDPAGLLGEMNRRLKAFLHRSDAPVPIDDGFDAAICRIDPGENRLVFAGAGLPLYLESGEGIREIKGDRAGVGDRRTSDRGAFTNHVLDLAGITKLFLATDGLTDQIGGESRLPFGRERFKRILHEIRTLPLSRQRQALSDAWHNHVGGEEIRDDLTVLGFSLTHLNKPASGCLEARETA
jgi:serine phosphatase RsbU (regulator of sigma subunit)